MAVLVSTLRTKLRNRLRDLSKPFPGHYLGTGNSSATVFYVDAPPIQDDSQAVYKDGVLQTETTHYTIDNRLGRITFVAAPTHGEHLTIDYNGLWFDDTDLTSSIEDAVDDMAIDYLIETFEVVTDVGGDYVSPEPNAYEQRLIVLRARTTIVEGLAREASQLATRVARTGGSFDTTERSERLVELAELLEKDFQFKAARYRLRLANLSTDDALKA